MPDNRGRISIRILQRRRIRWLFLLLILTALIIVRFVDYRGFAYGNLGFLSLNKALSEEKFPSQPHLSAAHHYLKQVVADPPVSSSYIFSLGRTSLLLGSEDAAHHFWKQADPRQIMTWQILWGDKYREQGQLDTALLWYHLAEQIAPDMADPWLRIGLVLESQQQIDDAEDAYRKGLSKSISSNVGSSDFYFRLAQLRAVKRKDRDWTVILALADEALVREEFSASFSEIQSHYLRGEALRQLGRNLEAIGEYQWVLKRRPDDYWSLIHYGKLIWLENLDLAPAQASLEKAIALQPARKWAYRTLADIYQESGKNDQAIELYKTVLELDPHDSWSQSQLTDHEATSP